jgi:hypothetical protein
MPGFLFLIEVALRLKRPFVGFLNGCCTSSGEEPLKSSVIGILRSHIALLQDDRQCIWWVGGVIEGRVSGAAGGMRDIRQPTLPAAGKEA